MFYFPIFEEATWNLGKNCMKLHRTLPKHTADSSEICIGTMAHRKCNLIECGFSVHSGIHKSFSLKIIPYLFVFPTRPHLFGQPHAPDLQVEFGLSGSCSCWRHGPDYSSTNLSWLPNSEAWNTPWAPVKFTYPFLLSYSSEKSVSSTIPACRVSSHLQNQNILETMEFVHTQPSSSLSSTCRSLPDLSVLNNTASPDHLTVM